MSEFQPLLEEIQKGNALTAELLKEKKLDDTAKQLLLGNLFEILNARDIFSKQQDRFEEGVVKRSSEEKKYDEKQPTEVGKQVGETVGKQFQSIADDTLIGSSGTEGSIAFLGKMGLKANLLSIDQSKFRNKYYVDSLDILNNIAEKLGAGTVSGEFFDLFENERLKNLKRNEKITKDLEDSFKKIDSAVAPKKTGFGGIPDPATLMGGKSAKEIEESKDKKTFFERLITSIAHPIDTLGGLFKDMGKKFTIGNATLATAIALFVSGMAAFFPKIANFIAGLATMVGAIFTGDGEAFGKAVGENIGGLFFLGLFLARKFIAGKFMSLIFTPLILPMLKTFYAKVIGSTLVKAASMLMRMNIVGIIITLIITFFTMFGKDIIDYIKRTSLSQFFADVATIMFNSIKKIFTTIGDLFKFFFGGGETTKPPEPKALGGPVAAGSSYLVGEKGPELFVPGAAGTIVPNGVMGGNIIVNNNQVNQSATSATHQHSNITLVDRQQEQVGL